MDPVTILALITGALPILQQLVTMGTQIATLVEQANTPAAKAVAQTAQVSHAATMTDVIDALLKSITTPPAPTPAA